MNDCMALPVTFFHWEECFRRYRLCWVFMKGSENWLKCQPEISRQRDLAFMLSLVRLLMLNFRCSIFQVSRPNIR